MPNSALKEIFTAELHKKRESNIEKLFQGTDSSPDQDGGDFEVEVSFKEVKNKVQQAIAETKPSGNKSQNFYVNEQKLQKPAALEKKTSHPQIQGRSADGKVVFVDFAKRNKPNNTTQVIEKESHLSQKSSPAPQKTFWEKAIQKVSNFWKNMGTAEKNVGSGPPPEAYHTPSNHPVHPNGNERPSSPSSPPPPPSPPRNSGGFQKKARIFTAFLLTSLASFGAGYWARGLKSDQQQSANLVSHPQVPAETPSAIPPENPTVTIPVPSISPSEKTAEPVPEKSIIPPPAPSSSTVPGKPPVPSVKPPVPKAPQPPAKIVPPAPIEKAPEKKNLPNILPPAIPQVSTNIPKPSFDTMTGEIKKEIRQAIADKMDAIKAEIERNPLLASSERLQVMIKANQASAERIISEYRDKLTPELKSELKKIVARQNPERSEILHDKEFIRLLECKILEPEISKLQVNYFSSTFPDNIFEGQKISIEIQTHSNFTGLRRK